MPPSDDTLTELRIVVARLDERTKAIMQKLDDAVVSREHLEQRLAPLTENMNKWKGGVAAITIVAGSIGAVITTVVKHLFTSGSSP